MGCHPSHEVVMNQPPAMEKISEETLNQFREECRIVATENCNDRLSSARGRFTSGEKLLVQVEKAFKNAKAYVSPKDRSKEMISVEMNEISDLDMCITCFLPLIRKNCLIGKLTLANGKVDASSMAEIGKAIRFNETLDELHLNSLQVPKEGINRLLPCFRESAGLRRFSMTNMPLNSASVLLVMHLLLDDSSLKYVNFDGAGLDEKALDAIAKGLQANTFLLEFEVCNNKLDVLTSPSMAAIKTVLDRNQTVAHSIDFILEAVHDRVESNLPSVHFSKEVPLPVDLKERGTFANSVIAGRKFSFGLADMQGRRDQMQDVTAIKINFRGRSDEHVFAVFDGHGGVQCARFVGRHFLGIFEDELNREEKALGGKRDQMNIQGCILRTFSTLNDYCVQYALQSGSCALVAYVVNHRIFTASAGDSRVILFRGGKGQLISSVFIPSEENEKARINALGGFVGMNGRLGGLLAVSRALGDIVFQPFISPVPGIDCVEMNDQDIGFCLACDGVWDVNDAQDAFDIVEPYEDSMKAAAMLRDMSYIKGSTDNISVIVVKLFSSE